MRQLGYPPGWLKEAEMEHSGLALYDGKGKERAVGMHFSCAGDLLATPYSGDNKVPSL